MDDRKNKLCQQAQQAERLVKTCKKGLSALPTCRIPDDCIDPRRYPLLAARETMRQLVDDLLGRSILAPGVL